MTWWALAIVVSCLACFVLDLNKKFQNDGLRTRAWTSGFAALFLTPLMVVMPFPTAPMFYVVAFVSAFILSFMDIQKLNLSRTYGGPLVSLSKPLQILFSFVVWCVVDFALTQEMFSRPVVWGGVLCSFALAGYANVKMFKAKVDLSAALRVVVLVGLIGGVMSPITKYGMSFTDGMIHAYVWSWIVYGLSAVICFVVHYARTNRPPMVTPNLMQAGLIFSGFKVFTGPLIVTAYHLAPNPAFVSLIMMLSTVWLMGFYRIKGLQSYVHPKTVALLLLSAAVLILTTKGL